SFQQVSIDEAYLDVSQKVHGDYAMAEELAQDIKVKVKKETGLTCSVGIGPNKIVAKMAASAKKPDGLTVVRLEQVRDFLYPLPLKKLHGIGPKTVDSLKFLGIETIGDLAKADVEKIKPILGKNKAEKLWNRARGEDEEHVMEEEKKQLGRMGTLKKDTQDPEYIAKFMEPMLDDIMTKLSAEGSTFRTVSITVVTSSMNVKTRSTTLDKSANSKDILRTSVMGLVMNYMRNNPQAVIRRFGVGVSKLEKNKSSGLSRFVKT
ncbi:MAG: helix-hairpin-helix domain-containing protein, partial [Candidatus Aenigmatarchaeota archaeon]